MLWLAPLQLQQVRRPVRTPAPFRTVTGSARAAFGTGVGLHGSGDRGAAALKAMVLRAAGNSNGDERPREVLGSGSYAQPHRAGPLPWGLAMVPGADGAPACGAAVRPRRRREVETHHCAAPAEARAYIRAADRVLSVHARGAPAHQPAAHSHRPDWTAKQLFFFLRRANRHPRDGSAA